MNKNVDNNLLVPWLYISFYTSFIDVYDKFVNLLYFNSCHKNLLVDKSGS